MSDMKFRLERVSAAASSLNSECYGVNVVIITVGRGPPDLFISDLILFESLARQGDAAWR
jgi:hypothetical protein